MSTPESKVQSSPKNGQRHRPKVIIVGAGFGGLSCAGALGPSPVDIVVIDRRNHHLFQPLLYQVATAALSPADIAEPIRKTLSRHKNISVVLGEVVSVDPQGQTLVTDDGHIHAYDYLILATGSEYNYFGHDDWKEFAPGLKSLRDSRQIRQRLLMAFEKAELATSPEEKRACLTTVVIGGGPTGVEMAGAISELGRFMIARDFRNLSPDEMHVMLVEAGPRLLATFPEKLAQYAENHLRNVGVDVLLGSRVTDISAHDVVINETRIKCGTIVWGAGIKASPAASWFGLSGDRIGRLPVSSSLEVSGFPHHFAIGDTALVVGGDGKPLPALAQVAKQQGEHLGKNLRRHIESGAQLEPFVFKNRGNTAVVGRNSAVFDFGSWTLKGRAAWFLWAIVHVYLLINFEKRLLVSIQWISRYFTKQRGARIIDENKVGRANTK
ncbi:NAD(P)/FAD-dependent oxidoreductase [Agrobacterium sp. CG674]